MHTSHLLDRKIGTSVEERGQKDQNHLEVQKGKENLDNQKAEKHLYHLYYILDWQT